MDRPLPDVLVPVHGAARPPGKPDGCLTMPWMPVASRSGKCEYGRARTQQVGDA